MANESKHDAFLRISNRRIDNLIVLINKLSNFRNKNAYEFTKKEINKIFDELSNALEEQRKTLLEKAI